MRTILPYSVGLLLTLCVAVTLTWGRSGLGVGDLAEQMAAEHQRSAALEERDRAVMRCLHGKRWVVDQLAGGQITLQEAAGLFRQLEEEVNQGDPRWAGPFRRSRSDEEVSLQVLTWLHGEEMEHSQANEPLESRL